jgi:hypothetical protein
MSQERDQWHILWICDVMSVLFNDSGSWLDFISPVVDQWIMLCVVEEVLTGQSYIMCRKMCHSATSSTINPMWMDPDSKPGCRCNGLRPKCKQDERNPLSSVPRQPQEYRFLFAGSQESPLVLLVRTVIKSTDEMIMTRENRSTLRKKSGLVPLCLPKIQHVTLWDWTRVSAVRGRRLTASAWVFPVNAIKVYGVSRGIAPLILNLSTLDRSESLISRSGRLYLRERTPVLIE